MAQHVVWVKRFGFSEKQEVLTFDTHENTRSDVEAAFIPYDHISNRGFIITAYNYNGDKYYDYRYLGIYPDDKIPKSDVEFWEYQKYRLDI